MMEQRIFRFAGYCMGVTSLGVLFGNNATKTRQGNILDLEKDENECVKIFY